MTVVTINDKETSNWRRRLIFILLLFMMLSLFLPRAFLSVGMIAFFGVSFFHSALRKQVLDFFNTPLLCGLSLLFFLPLLSGLWSEDKQTWFEMMRIKLPLLVLPLAFAAPFTLTKKQWDVACYFFIGLMVAGSAWAGFQYAGNFDDVNESYLRAKTMLVPMQDDHVRFSWLVSLAVLIGVWMIYQNRNHQRFLLVLLSIAVAWLIIFLHILAARTGLISFYIMVLVTLIWLLIRKKSRRYILILFGLLSLPILAYFILPSFQNRVKLISYEFDYFKHAAYIPGSGDAVRVISIKAGKEILLDNPLYGVGFGDIMAETGNWYKTNYPEMIEADRIYPSNEWLIYGSGLGVPGLLVFTFVMLIPFFTRIRNILVWWLLNSTAAVSFLFDIGLEVQYGVFAYVFLVLWQWKRERL